MKKKQMNINIHKHEAKVRKTLISTLYELVLGRDFESLLINIKRSAVSLGLGGSYQHSGG